MTALAKLPEKWQATAEAIAKPYGFVTEHTLGKAEALSNCADELTAALSPAELGGSELPVGEVSDGFSGHQRAVNLYGPIRCQPAPGTKLYTTPRAAEAVTEEMVDRAFEAFHLAPLYRSERERIRATLEYALTPPSAKGE